MVGGLVTGDDVVGQFYDTAGVVALGYRVVEAHCASSTRVVLAVVLRVSCFRGYFVAVLGRSGHV